MCHPKKRSYKFSINWCKQSCGDFTNIYIWKATFIDFCRVSNPTSSRSCSIALTIDMLKYDDLGGTMLLLGIMNNMGFNDIIKDLL